MAGQQGTPHWLVKSSGRVLGPYTTDEVVHLLKNKELAVFDEVSRPFRRWNYIRDEVEFAKAVEEMRQSGGSAIDEITSTMSTASMTSTDSITERVDHVRDDLTDDISLHRHGNEIVYEDIDEEPMSRSGAAPKGNAYGYMGDSALTKQTDRASQSMWFISGVIVILALAFVGYTRFIDKPKAKQTEASRALVEADFSYLTGDYKAALDSYKKLATEDLNQPDVMVRKAILLAQIEGQTAEARRLLQGVSGKAGAPLDEIDLGLGVIDLLEGNINGARQTLKKVISRNPFDMRALINMAAIAIKEKDWGAANGHLQSALRQAPFDPIAYVLLARVAVSQHAKGDKVAVRDVKQVLEGYDLDGDYQQEILLSRSYLDFLAATKMDWEQRISEILDIDPYQTSDFNHDPFIYRDAAGWDALKSWCETLTSQFDFSPRAIALAAYCHAKVKDGFTEARRTIDKAVAQSPNDPLVKTVQGFILFELGFVDKALSSWNAAIESDKQRSFVAPLIVMGRYCQNEKNYECAARVWDELIQKHPRSLQAIAGLSQIIFSQQDKGTAEEYLSRGLALAPNYRPLLKIKAEMSGNDAAQTN